MAFRIEDVLEGQPVGAVDPGIVKGCRTSDVLPIVTAIGGFATAPATTTGDGTAGPSAVAEWPAGEDGWTIALVSLPQTGGRAPALARVKAARRKGLDAVGVLDSSRYASLHPGYWIVFSGVYASEAEATSALEDARRYARAASVRHIVP